MNRRRGVDDSSDEEDAAPTVSTAPDVAEQSQDNHNSSSAEGLRSSASRVDDNNDDGSGGSDDEGSGDSADSSEEESDDDADELAKVREGFIVESDDEGDSNEEGSKPKHRKRRRRRARGDEDIQLDEDDLDLLGETSGAQPQTTRFKRLKRASAERKGGLNAMFDDNDEDEAEPDEQDVASSRRGGRGEFDDFIEADEFSEDEAEALRREEERETGQRRAAMKPGLAAVGDLAGLDEEKLSEIYDVFGDGEMYDWALEGEEDLDTAHPPSTTYRSGVDGEQATELQLTDVFEPSELAERLLTTEDNQIRSEDLPERFQLLRRRLRHSYELSDDAEYFEKKQWVADSLLALKAPAPEFREPTRAAVAQVVDFVARENLEVPFIWHHRQDYLVHFSSAAADATRTQLLTLDDLWRVLDLDLDFHALLERRRAARTLAQQVNDPNFPALEEDASAAAAKSSSGDAVSGVEYQDLIDYLQFAHSGTLRAQRRHSRFAIYDRIRSGPAMELVEALGVNLDDIAKIIDSDDLESAAASASTRKEPALSPTELAQELGVHAQDAEDYIATMLSFDPRVRRYFRSRFTQARINLVLTDDGRRKITSNSPFADLKYSWNWTLDELRQRPSLFLRMLRAESLGLLIVRAQYPDYKTTLYTQFERVLTGLPPSTGTSTWFEARQRIAKAASRQIVPLVARNVLESLRAQCALSLRDEVRQAFAHRLDAAPFKPPGYVIGTVPRVMVIGAGEAGPQDAVLAATVDEDGHVSEVVKLGSTRNAGFASKLVETVRNVRPDVVGVAGFTPAARRLHQAVHSAIVDSAQLTAGPEDAEQPLEVVWVQDEVARLYRNSPKAAHEFPDLVPNARYCVAAARYLQSPVLEYAQLDAAQLHSLPLHPEQSLLTEEDMSWALETAFVDCVCLEGVDINLALRSSYHAAALGYVAGLGKRKAGGVIQASLARAKGGQIANRTQLVTAEITSKTVFMNCASFLRIPWSTSTTSVDSEYLDATRVHPEDYELARKMAADALELDEEDIEAVEERQAGGVVGQLLNDDPEGRKLDELVLEEYAEELENMFKQRKRITLDQIRREIQDAYAEMRAPFHQVTADEVFTMLTGETRTTFGVGSIVSGQVRRVTGRQLLLTLSSGVDAVAEAGTISDDRSVPLVQQFAPGQTVQAVVVSVDYGALYAKVNTRESAVADAQRRLDSRTNIHDEKHWNQGAEDRDDNALRRRVEQKQRQMRVIKHPLFRAFSAKEAEAYLAPLQRGDLIIRPSSRGLDHLVVTWKVGEMIYQHIDVAELDKPNEYALGRTLQVGPYRYADLDELIIMHVQSMARKVDEMAQSEKFQRGNKGDVEKWLKAYTNARPTQSVYAYCFDHRRPGYFLLCFMLGASAPIKELHVKTLPNGYELLGNAYADVQALSNGFKTMVQRARV